MTKSLAAFCVTVIALVMFGSSVVADEEETSSPAERLSPTQQRYKNPVHRPNDDASMFMVGNGPTCRTNEDGSRICIGMGRVQMRPPDTPDDAVFACNGRGLRSRCLFQAVRPRQEFNDVENAAWNRAAIIGCHIMSSQTRSSCLNSAYDDDDDDDDNDDGGVRECVDRTERLPSGLMREWRDCSSGAVAVTIE